MFRIMFVCHGNICRSPMAEAIFRYIASDSYSVSSAGVSSEESGNDIYPPAKRVLKKNSIPFSSHRAHRITDADFSSSDLIVALDSYNLRALRNRFGNSDKIIMLNDKDVDDPWYTDDFDTAYAEIYSGCAKLLENLKLIVAED